MAGVPDQQYVTGIAAEDDAVTRRAVMADGYIHVLRPARTCRTKTGLKQRQHPIVSSEVSFEQSIVHALMHLT